MPNDNEQNRAEQEKEIARELYRQRRMALSPPLGEIPSGEISQAGLSPEVQGAKKKEVLGEGATREEGQKAQGREQTEVEPEKEARLARALRQKREQSLKSQKAKQAVEALKGIGGVGGAKDVYKGIKQIIRVIKLVTGGAGSIGEILVSAPSFILVAHAEWLYSAFLNPKYKIAWWEKALVLIADFIIFVIFLLVIVLIALIAYFIQNPLSAIQAMGLGALKPLWDMFH